MKSHYYFKHRDRILEKQREKSQNNPLQRLFWNCKSSARRRGIEWKLDITDLVVPTHCPYLGMELKFVPGRGHQPSRPSIDRKDSSKGYTPDNIEIISMKANMMKQNATADELAVFATEVLRRYG